MSLDSSQTFEAANKLEITYWLFSNRRSSVLEEQITRQLIGLHRAVTHKDKNLLNQVKFNKYLTIIN